jgi:signal transduction histidine kinase/CheY-like chemotaxis protein
VDATRTQPISNAVLAVVHRMLGTRLCLVGRIVGERFVVHEVLDKIGIGIERDHSVDLRDTLAAVVEQTRGGVVWGDLAPIETPFERSLDIRAALLVPLLLRDGTVVGALCAYDRESRTFDERDMELVSDLGRAVTAEIEEGLRLDRAVELERAKLAGLLARGLAHDFGNIVSSALANLRSIARILGDHPQVKEPIEELTASLESGRELIARLRDVGRTDARGARRRGIDPTAVASKVVAMARAVFKGGRVHIDLRLVPPDMPMEIRGDEHALEQALLNVVLNARDAVGERGGRVTVRVIYQRVTSAALSHPWETPGDWAVLAVDDDGPGIDPEHRAHIFEPGFTSKGERGSGLGLFLVSTTATAHGGGVFVDRSPEGGARVAISLPATRKSASMLLRMPLVLVADDERGLRRACARELSAAGLAVTEASNRAAALEIVEADPKRIVAAIIDRDLGDGSGEDVANRLRALNPNALVIETSGGAEGGGGQVLEKPFDLPQLVERVLAKVRTIV